MDGPPPSTNNNSQRRERDEIDWFRLRGALRLISNSSEAIHAESSVWTQGVEVVHVRSSVVVGGTVEVAGAVVVGRTMAANAPDGRDGMDSVRDMESWKHDLIFQISVISKDLYTSRPKSVSSFLRQNPLSDLRIPRH